MMISQRPLKGCVVGISISESEDMERLGFDRGEMNRCVVRLSEVLLAAGARLAFGHDWRPGGVMEAVAALAVRYFDVHRGADGKVRPAQPPIINRVAAGEPVFLLESNERENPMVRLLEGIVEAKQSEAPTGANRADALSALREELSEICHVRVCLGGKLTNFSGHMPGILEEAIGTLWYQRPVFTSGIFGGAAAIVAWGLSQGQFQVPDRWLGEFEDHAVITAILADQAPKTLTDAEQLRLWQSASVEESIELILRGIVKYWSQRRQ